MKYILSLLAFFTTAVIFAQITYMPGYFIDNNGKKTECLIKNVAWKDNPVEFEYKRDEAAEPQKALIKDVSEFSVDNAYKYVRYTVDVDLSSNDISNLSLKKEPEWIKDTVLLEVLVQGDITLYEYTKGNKVRFFYASNGTPQQLVYKTYKSDNAIGYNYSFRGQLYEAMKSKITDQKRYKNLRYDKDALIKLFLEYNGGEGQIEQTVDFSSRHNKTEFNVKLTAGVNLASASLERENFDVVSTVDFDKKAVFSIGLEAELIFPFNNRKWSMFANPNYQSYKSSATTVENVLTQYWQVEYSFIEIPIGIRHYMYLNDNSKLFINAGYSIVLPVGDGNINYRYDGSNSIDFVRKESTSKSSNLIVGGGFSYDRYSVEVRYNAPREIIVNKPYWDSKYSSIGVILSYKLF